METLSVSFYDLSIGQHLQNSGATQHNPRVAEANAEEWLIDLHTTNAISF
jgi:hypothetical protein